MRPPLPLITTLLLSATLAAAADAPSHSDRHITIKIPGGSDATREFIKAYDPSQVTVTDAARTIPVLRDRANHLNIATPVGRERVQEGLLEFGFRVTLNDSDIPLGQDAPALANQLADAMVDLLRSRVDPAWHQVIANRRQQADTAAKESADIRKKLDAARTAVRDAEANLQSSTGRIDLSPDGLRAAKDALELERQRTELDLAGLSARRAAIEQAIDQQSARAKSDRANDATIQVLKKAVEASRQRLEQARRMLKENSASASEVTQAELAAMEAEARLIEREATGGGAADAMAQWNRELVAATIDQREKEARLTAATKRLATLVEATEAGRQLITLQDEVSGYQHHLKQSEQHHRYLLEWLEEHHDSHPTFKAATPPD